MINIGNGEIQKHKIRKYRKGLNDLFAIHAKLQIMLKIRYEENMENA